MIRHTLEGLSEKISSLMRERETIKEEIKQKYSWTGWNSTQPEEYKERTNQIRIDLHVARSALGMLKNRAGRENPPRSYQFKPTTPPRPKHSTYKYTRQEYTKAINRLEEQRGRIKREIMAETGWSGGASTAPPEYAKRVRSIGNKIRHYRTNSKNIGKRHKELVSYAKKVEEFFGEKLVEQPVKWLHPTPLHGVFMKYGMENGFRGAKLSRLIGVSQASSKSAGHRIRRNFTRSFEGTPNNREVYHRFLQYMRSFE